jgi:hypothetical protein
MHTVPEATLATMISCAGGGVSQKIFLQSSYLGSLLHIYLSHNSVQKKNFNLL